MKTICSCKVLPLLISARKENSNKKLKDTNNTLEQEIEALTHKIERMNTMQRQVRACDVMTSNYMCASSNDIPFLVLIFISRLPPATTTTTTWARARL